VLTLSTVTLDLKKIGYNALARILLKCERSKMSEISDKILQMPNMIVFLRLIGSYDLLAIAALEDLSDFIRLQNKIHAMSGAEEIDFSLIEMWPAWPLTVFAPLLE
jgi:hypothetical protein